MTYCKCWLLSMEIFMGFGSVNRTVCAYWMWFVFLPEAAHEHTFYSRPWRDKDTITHQSYSNNCIQNQFIAIVCSCGSPSFFSFCSAGFTLISTLTFLANFAKYVRGSRLIGHPSSILNEWLWQASNRRVGRFDTGCCVVEETWAPINKHSFI